MKVFGIILAVVGLIGLAIVFPFLWLVYIVIAGVIFFFWER